MRVAGFLRWLVSLWPRIFVVELIGGVVFVLVAVLAAIAGFPPKYPEGSVATRGSRTADPVAFNANRPPAPAGPRSSGGGWVPCPGSTAVACTQGPNGDRYLASESTWRLELWVVKDADGDPQNLRLCVPANDRSQQCASSTSRDSKKIYFGSGDVSVVVTPRQLEAGLELDATGDDGQSHRIELGLENKGVRASEVLFNRGLLLRLKKGPIDGVVFKLSAAESEASGAPTRGTVDNPDRPPAQDPLARSGAAHRFFLDITPASWGGTMYWAPQLKNILILYLFLVFLAAMWLATLEVESEEASLRDATTIVATTMGFSLVHAIVLPLTAGALLCAVVPTLSLIFDQPVALRLSFIWFIILSLATLTFLLLAVLDLRQWTGGTRSRSSSGLVKQAIQFAYLALGVVGSLFTARDIVRMLGFM